MKLKIWQLGTYNDFNTVGKYIVKVEDLRALLEGAAFLSNPPTKYSYCTPDYCKGYRDGQLKKQKELLALLERL